MQSTSDHTDLKVFILEMLLHNQYVRDPKILNISVLSKN